ncbi:MAG: DEAD/DEAH box helicase, partial [Chamaesiphon sp.]|nr:DEAD/DEAH box helicase [Chamaesiphon sp.]
HGTNACIVCTSTLELGIDVGDLDLVLQANAPSTVSSFLQRLGRTGRRAGQRANTTFYCEDIEPVLQAIAIIELARTGWVESVPVQTRAWPVLVHQLLALTLQFGGVSPERCWEYLSVVPDFSGIAYDEFETLIQHMTQTGYLFISGGLLSIGDRAEKVYGRKNFMELYAVFSSPQLYKVQTKANYTIGSLEQIFVDKLVPEVSSFILGGKSWTVLSVNHPERSVLVIPAPRGKKPSWGGFIPQLLGFELCQQVQQIILSKDPLPYLDEQAQFVLDEYRNELAPLLKSSGWSLQFDPDRAIWWTFAGGAINHTLKYGLQVYLDSKIVVDNFKLKIEGDSLTMNSLKLAIDEISHPSFWQSAATQNAISMNLPEYRLSKFQQALPDIYSIEIIQNYLLDIPKSIEFLQSFR